MKTLALLIAGCTMIGCYTTMYHPGPIRPSSMSASESCGGCHEKPSDYTYYTDDDRLTPLIEPSENDAVEEFVELTRSRVRVQESDPYVAPVFPNAVWITQPTFQNSTAVQEPQVEHAEEKSTSERRTYGLRTTSKKEKERKFQ